MPKFMHYVSHLWFTNSVRKVRSRRFARAVIGLGVCFLALMASAQLQDFSSYMYRKNAPAGFFPSGTLGFGASLNYGLNGAAGTVCNQLVKLDGAGKLVVTAGGETSGVIGVAVSGCGNTGTVQYAVVGQVAIIFDTSTVAVGDYVAISASTGVANDVGSTPGSGQNIGRIILGPTGAAPTACNSAANCYVQLQLGSASGGGGGGGCVSGCVLLAPLGSQTINQPGSSPFTINGGNLIVNAPGPINGWFIPDSGSNTTNGTDNTALWLSGTPPVTSTLDPGSSYRPLLSVRHSGVAYLAEMQTKAEYAAANGYAPLDSGALIPLANMVADPSGCNAASFLKGDRSGCAGSSATPSFSSLTSGTNTTMVAVCGAGCSIQPTGSGIINANFIASNTFNAQASAANQTFVSVGIGNLSPIAIPDCSGANNAFQGINASTHLFRPCATVASGIPMAQFSCTGVNGACPNATEYTGTANDHILAQVTIAANQLTVGKCIHAISWFQHSTGTASVAYRWNVGGAGAVDTDVTGGTNTANQNSTSTANYMEMQLEVCAYTANTVYLRSHALQAGAAQVAGSVIQSVSLTLSSSFTINLLFNVAATDKALFNGGYVNFP